MPNAYFTVSRHLQTWYLSNKVPSTVSKQANKRHQFEVFLFCPWTFTHFLLNHFHTPLLLEMESFLSSVLSFFIYHLLPPMQPLPTFIYTPCRTHSLFFISHFAYPPFIWSFFHDDITRYVEIIRVIDQYVHVTFTIFIFSSTHTHHFIHVELIWQMFFSPSSTFPYAFSTPNFSLINHIFSSYAWICLIGASI